MQTFAKQMVYQLIAVPDLNQVSFFLDADTSSAYNGQKIGSTTISTARIRSVSGTPTLT